MDPPLLDDSPTQAHVSLIKHNGRDLFQDMANPFAATRYHSLIVAEAYLRDHAQIVRSDIMVMGYDIARNKSVFDQDSDKLRQFLTFQAQVRGLAAAIVLDKELKVIARADLNINQTFALPPRDALPLIGSKEPQVVLLPDANYVAAVVKLDQYEDYYLYLTRLLDPRVVPQLQATRASATEYAALETRRAGVQVAFALMYTVIALTVLLSAVWIGLNFANRLVAPIRRLIGAANAVSTGNLYVRVPVRQAEGDLAQLGERTPGGGSGSLLDWRRRARDEHR